MMVESGKTVMIGGLTTDSETEIKTKVPLLGDIPLIGDLVKDPRDKKALQVQIAPQAFGRPFATGPGVPKARAEMLRVRTEPVAGLVPGQSFQYAVDFDLDGQSDLGSTTKLDGQPHAPIGTVVQFFHRGTGRGDQFRVDFQKLFDEGIQIALKHLGE